MSYRELRNFTEMMRALGYPRLISMENFRRPNFELVADIIFWMVKLYDPETSISDRVEFEDERVEFLTGIAALMATKARLKLNIKKLYASDGRAVQELIKIANLLYKAIKSVSSSTDDINIPHPVKVQEVKVARTLASDITQSGAKLFDFLATEATDRQERTRSLRFLDMTATAAEGSREQQFIERCLREIIDGTRQAVEDARKECEELEADERNIESKIRKKQEELERTEKRLRSLENVRPQFMDEVEKLEKELQRHYDIYIEKYRNLDYLEHELEQYHRSEEERKEQHDRRLKKMRERLLKEEVELLRGGRERGDDEDDRRGPSKGDYGGGGSSRAVANRPAPARQAVVSGSMGGSVDSDGESSDGGDGSDGDMSGSLSRGGSDDEEMSGGGSGGGNEDDRRRMGDGRGAGGRRGRAGSDQDSEEFLDDDDDESGSDEHF